MFYNIIIAPIELIINWVFVFISNKFNSFGIIFSVFGVSLAMNFMALPIYNIADKIQEKERNISKKLSKQVKRIKETFRGDEQFMMLQAYYKEEHYHPLYVFRSSLSILIEIPFFIAAYHYLSHCDALLGNSFWIFKDLGNPDHIFSIPFGQKVFYINILPILMTLINFVSGAIYLKDAPFREKFQLYGVALVFLALLYNSPSGLVIYWILNNLFSLAKNIVMKAKKPGKILHLLVSALLLFVAVFFLVSKGAFIKKLLVLFFAIFVSVLPYVINYLKAKSVIKASKTEIKTGKTDFIILLLSGLGLSITLGLLLPTTIISSSTVEFSFQGNTISPLTYIKNSFTIFLGLFLFWPLVIYKMFGEKVKKVESSLFFIMLLLALSNIFIFKYNYGIIDLTFNVEHTEELQNYSPFFTVLPLLFLCIVIALLYFAQKKKLCKFIPVICVTLCLSEAVLSIINLKKINREFLAFKQEKEQLDNTSTETDEIAKDIHFSKNKKNVLVLFMDRAIGCYLPYFFEQFPEYKESFSGFVNFENTLSYGAYTITGVPPILGGYEYTPENMNKRDKELLVNKHNEASILLPTLFSEAGYHSTIINPPWPNYKYNEFCDYSAFDNLKNTEVKNLIGVYSKKYKDELNLEFEIDEVIKREILNFNVMQSLPPLLRNTFYGNFRNVRLDLNDFINAYSPLYYINDETDFTSKDDNFIFITNETIHRIAYMNESFDAPTKSKTSNSETYKTATDFETQLYQVFCAAFIKLAKYFDYLKENGVYDNTRIIIVSDHGYHIQMAKYKNFTPKTVPETLYNFTKGNKQIPSSFDCLLMFKDFNQNTPIENDKTFMTNADTPSLALKNLGISLKNPFTNKVLVSEKENGINLYFNAESEIQGPDIIQNTKFTLDKKTAWHYNDLSGKGISDPENWKPLPIWEKSE